MAERGIAAEWKHNRQGYVREVATTMAVAGVVVGVAWLVVRAVRAGD